MLNRIQLLKKLMCENQTHFAIALLIYPHETSPSAKLEPVRNQRWVKNRDQTRADLTVS